MKNYRYFIALIVFSQNLYASPLEEHMVYPSELVGGKEVVEYANIWWQWTYSMPKEISPVRDVTGENCHAGQNGEVWFLAGGYGTSKIKRRCEIPEGKYIFFPVINMVYWPREEGSLSCENAKKYAALNNDELLSIEVELDSIKASNPAQTRISSEKCFDLLSLVSRDQNPPKVYPSASDGYWVMLKPLSKGVHSLKFNAMYNRENSAYGKMAQDLEYEIIIK
jgi:hypothetical protein